MERSQKVGVYARKSYIRNCLVNLNNKETSKAWIKSFRTAQFDCWSMWFSLFFHQLEFHSWAKLTIWEIVIKDCSQSNCFNIDLLSFMANV